MRKKIKKLFASQAFQSIGKRLKHSKKNHRHPDYSSKETDDQVLQCIVAYNQYGGYCVPKRSSYRPAAQSILAGEVWEPDTIEFMVKHASNGDIIHAGTYFGDFIPALSRACRIGAKVWAFEPNPENYRCALITCAINNLVNVEIRNAGIGDKNASLPMRVFDDKGRALGGTSRLLEVSGDAMPEQTIVVDIVRLDDVVPANRNVSILQLDVEGFEQQALSGALDIIRRCRPVLILENLPESSWLNENIIKLGYKFLRKLHQNTVMVFDDTGHRPQ